MLVTSGVSFAVVLMFMQIGFRNALFDNTVQLAKLFKADLFLVSKARYNLPSEQRFDQLFLDRAKSLPGVADVLPIYIERSQTEIRTVGHISRAIRVVAVPLYGQVFADAQLDQARARLSDGRTGFLDRRTKRYYGFDMNRAENLREQAIELGSKSLALVDYVEVGTDFVHDGTIIVAESAVPHYFPFRNAGSNPLGTVDIGLVQLSGTTDLEATLAAVRDIAPNEIDVLSKQQIIDREIHFWATATPIGIIFTVGTIVGLVVGTIICYQILFTDITDHIAEFATLKAMGYGTGYFSILILQQSLLLTLLGFLPGWLVTYGLYELLSRTTGLVMLLTPARIGLVFFLTLGMCLVSGLLAVRKLLLADPASLFR